VLWLKAQLIRGAANVDRVSRPMTVFQLVSYAIVAGGWAALLTWKWDVVQRWLLSLTPAGFMAGASGVSGPISILFFIGVFVLSSLTVMVSLHTILAEE
jgi:hypothetical protein